MTHTHDEVTVSVKALVETCAAGERAFRAAAESLGDQGESHLRNVLRAYAVQRAAFAAELKALWPAGWPAQSAVVLTVAPGKDEAQIVEEVEASERSAMRIYEETLKKQLTDAVKGAAERQYSEIRRSYDRLHALECAYTCAA